MSENLRSKRFKETNGFTRSISENVIPQRFSKNLNRSHAVIFDHKGDLRLIKKFDPRLLDIIRFYSPTAFRHPPPALNLAKEIQKTYFSPDSFTRFPIPNRLAAVLQAIYSNFSKITDKSLMHIRKNLNRLKFL